MSGIQSCKLLVTSKRGHMTNELQSVHAHGYLETAILARGKVARCRMPPSGSWGCLKVIEWKLEVRCAFSHLWNEAHFWPLCLKLWQP